MSAEPETAGDGLIRDDARLDVTNIANAANSLHPVEKTQFPAQVAHVHVNTGIEPRPVAV